MDAPTEEVPEPPVMLTVDALQHTIVLDRCTGFTPATLVDVAAGTHTIALTASTLSKGSVSVNDVNVDSFDDYVIVNVPLPAADQSSRRFFMVPFYIFYSMFGFQRVGDLAWAAGDMQARGFLLGATAGRTTLNGEGLQHQDGHSHLMSATIPNCISYDPTFAHEFAVIMHAGDLISEIALAIEMGADAVDIGRTIHPHPTLSESVGMAAEVAEGVCTDLPPPRR